MDEDNNIDRSESTEENEERSETETECFDKTDSDIISQNEITSEPQCTECRITFPTSDDLKNHNIHKHPILMYKCTVSDCLRWFSSRKSRDKHSENLKSRLHSSTSVKSPPPNAVFIEEATQEQLEIIRNNRFKNKRGPKPKHSNDNENDFLIGLPRDQLKRKLMESVVEKIESTPNKKNIQGHESSVSLPRASKRRPSLGQLSQTSSITIPNVSSPKPTSTKGSSNKIPDTKNSSTSVPVVKTKPIPDLSHIKVPILSVAPSCSFEKFAEDLINLLVLYDPAEYFTYPLIDCFAPSSSQLTERIDMKSIKKRLKQGHYSKTLENLQHDLLLLYSSGMDCFDEKSASWNEAAKLYQTAVVNIQEAKKIFADLNNSKNNECKKQNISTNVHTNFDDRYTYLNIMNPYNNGKINDHERIMTIGDQLGKLKSGTSNLLGYKEDRRNKVAVLSYLDYGANFSFGPSFDSGNAYCSKDASDLLIRRYGENNSEDVSSDELNEIIPETMLGDDFSFYLMNAFTRDIVKSYRNQISEQQSSSIKQHNENTFNEVNESKINKSTLQTLLDDSWKDLAMLKSFNYQRLSNYQLHPSNDEQSLSEKVTMNLTNLILKTNPESVTNVNVIHKVLNSA